MIKIDFFDRAKKTAVNYVLSWNGNKFLYDEMGKFHSYNDLPAVIWHSGTKYWYKHGKLHRDNGLPAIIWSDGHKEYWINGSRIK